MNLKIGTRFTVMEDGVPVGYEMVDVCIDIRDREASVLAHVRVVTPGLRCGGSTMMPLSTLVSLHADGCAHAEDEHPAVSRVARAAEHMRVWRARGYK